MKFNENECYIMNANQDLVLIVKNKKTIQAFSHEMKKHISHLRNKKKPEFKNDKNKIKPKHKILRSKNNVLNHQILKLKL